MYIMCYRYKFTKRNLHQIYDHYNFIHEFRFHML